MRLENWFLLPLMNLVKIFSTSVMMSLCGSGRAVARWVNLERRQVLIMFTFAVVVRCMVDHWKISSRTALMALVQFTSRWSRSPVRVIPSSLKGDGSIEKPVVAGVRDARGWSDIDTVDIMDCQLNPFS